MLTRLGLLLMLAPAPTTAPYDLTPVRVAAQAGQADAQFQLAEAYRTGRGVTPDLDVAIGWYRRAAQQGHARASDELGIALFADGERREAIPYIEKAAARGDPRAFYLLGTAHFNGDYVTRDWPLAYAQMSRAAAAGLPAAQRSLDTMGRYLLPNDKAKADEILATLPPVRVIAVTPPRPAPASPAAPAAATPPPPAPTRGPWRVQLGAFGSAERARAGWARLLGPVPRLARLDQRIVAAGAVQRLQATGLATRADADALCRDVRRAGGDCFPVAP
jgi:uncharacterized protein